MKMSEILDIAENESSTENDKSTSSSGKTKTFGNNLYTDGRKYSVIDIPATYIHL